MMISLFAVAALICKLIGVQYLNVRKVALARRNLAANRHLILPLPESQFQQPVLICEIIHLALRERHVGSTLGTRKMLRAVFTSQSWGSDDIDFAHRSPGSGNSLSPLTPLPPYLNVNSSWGVSPVCLMQFMIVENSLICCLINCTSGIWQFVHSPISELETDCLSLA